MKKAQTGSIITLVVLVILGVVFLAVIADLVSLNTEPQSISSEEVTGSNSTAVQFANTDWSTNATCNCTPFVATFTLGQAQWSNDSCNANLVDCSYSYYDANYLDSGTGRTITALLTILFSVFVLILIVGGLAFRNR